MTLTLYYHPLSSYCMKVLIALYETGAPFEPKLVNLQDPTERAAFLALWPIGKFPLVQDDATGQVIPESSIIIEYLAQRHPGQSQLVPADADKALDVRAKDRLFDHYIHTPMQKIVGDRLRPEGKRDPFGVEHAREQAQIAYSIVDNDLRNSKWAVGDTFTLADCAAAPALFYANQMVPIGDRKHLAGYLGRLLERPSFARVIAEAQPYFAMVPR